MASAVSLDYQTFWTQPRKPPRASVNYQGKRPFMPRAVERSTYEPICIPDCKSTSVCNDNGVDCAGDIAQPGDIVRLPYVPLEQESLADGMARPQVATVVSGVGKTGSMGVPASSQADPLNWSSSASVTSRSTPFATQNDDMPLDYGNDELYPIDPGLGPSVDCATTCYPVVDLDNVPDALGTVALEQSLPSRDTPAVVLSGYASDTAVKASNLPRKAVRSVSCPSRFWQPLEGTENLDKRLYKRVSQADKEALHDDNHSTRAEADAHRTPSDYDQHFQTVDVSMEEPPLKRCRTERFSEGHGERVGERRSRCSSIDSTVRVDETDIPRPALNNPNSTAAGASNDDFHDGAGIADFEEWPLHNVVLKRITLKGVATFQLQFDWNLCAAHSHLSRAIPKKRNKPDRSDRRRRTADHSATRSKFTPDEDNLIVLLKEEQQLSWTEIHEIHQRRSSHFPTRSKESLQVRYCTKLKAREDHDSSPALI